MRPARATLEYRCAGATGLRNWLTPAAWVAAVTAVLLVVFPVGFPNYDTIYALVWGRELAHGVSPDYGAALPPTPHPLADLLGLVTTPFGDGAITVTMIVAYASLGLIGYLVYRLGSLWFDRWIGAVAAAIVLTRAPFLSNGLRAYVDLPYIALCLGALTIEARRPRAGWPVLALLVLAGLLRPEAWLFAGRLLALADLRLAADRRGPTQELSAIDGFGWRGAARWRGARPGWRLLAPAGPILWVLFDGITTGNPLYSLTGTQETVETLKRQTGPVDLVLYGPRRLGEVLQWPGMVGALGGVVLGFAFLRRRSALGIAAVVLALGAFALLGRGRPGDHRPLHDARRGDPGDLRRPRAARLAAARAAATPGGAAGRSSPASSLLMFLVWLPNQWNLDSQVHTDLTNQGTDRERPHRPGRRRRLRAALRPDRGAQPPRRPPPRLRPRSEADRDRQRQRGRRSPASGYFVAPASPFVIHNFILDPNDPTRFSLNEGPPAASARSRQTSPGRSTAAAERLAALGPHDRGVGGGGEVGVGEVDPRRQLDVEVVGGVEAGAQSVRARVEDVAAAAAVVADEVEVVAGDLDPLDVGGEAEAEHRAGDVGELEDVLVGDDLGQRPVGRRLAPAPSGRGPARSGRRGGSRRRRRRPGPGASSRASSASWSRARRRSARRSSARSW